MKCTDVSELIVDYLYEEMGADQRRAFEAHVAGCAACRAEVEGMQATLGLARATLAANDEPVPAPVHATAAALVGVAVRTGTTGPRPLGEPVIPEDAGGVWAWLRKPWFFPAFAAASAIGLFFLAREALLPTAEVTVASPPREIAGKGSQAKAEADDVPAAAPTAAPVAASPSPATGNDESDEDGAGAVPTASRKRNAPETPSPQKRAVQPAFDDGGGAVAEGARATGGAAPAPSRGAFAGLGESRARTKVAAKPAAAGGRAADAPSTSVRTPTIPIAAPYARAREQRRDVRSPMPEQPAPIEAEEEGDESGSVTEALVRESASKAEAEPRAQVRVRQVADAPTPAAPPSAAAPAAPAMTAESAPSGVSNALAAAPADVTSQAALIDLGNRLYAEKRMADAAAIYRDLIKRFPKHPDAAIWKARLEQATAIVNESRQPPTRTRGPAKAATAKPADQPAAAPAQ